MAECISAVYNGRAREKARVTATHRAHALAAAKTAIDRLRVQEIDSDTRKSILLICRQRRATRTEAPRGLR